MLKNCSVYKKTWVSTAVCSTWVLGKTCKKTDREIPTHTYMTHPKSVLGETPQRSLAHSGMYNIIPVASTHDFVSDFAVEFPRFKVDKNKASKRFLCKIRL
jgi:hypothetical protein